MPKKMAKADKKAAKKMDEYKEGTSKTDKMPKAQKPTNKKK